MEKMSSPELKTPGLAELKTIADAPSATTWSTDVLMSDRSCLFSVLTGGALNAREATPCGIMSILTEDIRAATRLTACRDNILKEQLFCINDQRFVSFAVL